VRPLPAQLPKGARVYLPDEAARKRHAETRLLSVFTRWGYREIVTSTYEYADVLATGTDADVQAVLEGLRDGTLDVIASDHAPHAPEKKMRELDQAPNGVIGLETLLPVCVKALIEPGVLTWPQLIEKLTVNPARVLSIDRGTLQPGAVADVTVIDPNAGWTIDPGKFRSKSRNSPFAGWQVRGWADTVLVGGVVKFDRRGPAER